MSAPTRTTSEVARTRRPEPPYPGGRHRRGTRTIRAVVALTFLGLLFNLVITIDPGSSDPSSVATAPRQSTALTPVETVPMATAEAAARAAGSVASGVAGFASSSVPSADTTAQALTAMAGPAAPTTRSPDRATAESIGAGDSVLSRVGASITAVVSGLVPVVPPVLPLSMLRRIAAEATSSSGFNGPEDGSGPAILILIGLCVCATFPARRFADDRARLAWSFVAPLLRPG